MARKAVACVVQLRLTNGQAVVTTVNQPPDPVNGATTATDQAAVEAAVAVLEGDGASPTQAHVNSLRTVWDALVLDISAVPASADVVISYNASTVVSRDTLRQALDAMLNMLPSTL
jgi:hypothetical protein